MLLIATFTDLKSLEVPDWLTHGGIILGVLLGLFFSLLNWSIWPLALSLAGLAITFAIACLMFYTGQWGGGDAKLLMAMGALIGFELNPFSFGVSFLVNLVFLGGIWGIAWSVYLALRSRAKTWKVFKKIRQEPKYRRVRAASVVTTTILLVLSFFWTEVQVPLVVLAILVYLLAILVIFTKSVELSAMEQWVTPDKLTEGDWLVKPVKAGGKTISPQKTGLAQEQVDLLKKAYKHKKIDKVLVKYGVPFVPAFLLAFLATLGVGNIALLLLTVAP